MSLEDFLHGCPACKNCPQSKKCGQHRNCIPFREWFSEGLLLASDVINTVAKQQRSRLAANKTD